MTFLWILVIIAAALFEGVTAGLVSLWFVIGGIVSMILSMFGVDEFIQIIVFIVVSVLAMIALRPFIKKSVYKRTGEESKTNVDRLIGKSGIVTEQIDDLKNTGEVIINGQRWSAKPVSDNLDLIVDVGSKVEIKGIEGVKLIVQLSKD